MKTPHSTSRSPFLHVLVFLARIPYAINPFLDVLARILRMRVRVPRSPSPSGSDPNHVRLYDALIAFMNACMNALTGGMNA